MRGVRNEHLISPYLHDPIHRATECPTTVGTWRKMRNHGISNIMSFKQNSKLQTIVHGSYYKTNGSFRNHNAIAVKLYTHELGIAKCSCYEPNTQACKIISIIFDNKRIFILISGHHCDINLQSNYSVWNNMWERFL